MITATRILPAGTWSGMPADTLTLDRDDRHRRRLVMRCSGKTVFLLDLPEAKVLKDGDAVELEDGRLILVQAVPEALLEITAASAADLVRVAWHLGNRHLPTQFKGDKLRIREDHVIEDMLGKLGAEVKHILAAFDPEGGAYGHGSVQGHDHDHGHGGHHGHDHDHDHGHHHAHGEDCGCGHDHGHAHEHEHDHGHHHAHGEACDCGHDHGHSHEADHHHGHGHHHAHGDDCGCGHDHSHGHSHGHDHKHD
ncbi:urease accessory protein UreE [Oryzibacter oryziterrae]|uniref:urease accessory protein UreE n=1 Tax=Oryzibacter oryziterrae TaxID=2766474 RepID=UPI001F21CA0D|nr:urease accessory protein UreE [Oryzibacter oryziterrae]